MYNFVEECITYRRLIKQTPNLIEYLKTLRPVFVHPHPISSPLLPR